VGYTDEATALFSRFAKRHGLHHLEIDAPVEVLWEFPIQTGLSLPLTLGLQNNDELNFGVPGFWSYFFPFPRIAEEFESCLDAWLWDRQGSCGGADLHRSHPQAFLRFAKTANGKLFTEILAVTGHTLLMSSKIRPITYRMASGGE